MTAEVAILNKQCVALAADSAVTTGNTKVFNTVNKLFGLSKHQLVGVMAYSSAEVMGVPIETVIKEFRRTQGGVGLDHLEDYKEAFENFLVSDDKTLFDDDARIRSLQDLVWRLFDVLEDRAFRKLKSVTTSWGHPTSDEATAALLESLSEMERQSQQSSEIKVENKAQTRRVVKGAVGDEINVALKALEGTFPLTPTVNKRIRTLAIDHLFRERSFGGETGFVVAGFGQDDIFPRLRAFEFSCAAFGLNKMEQFPPIDISRDNIAVITPFAQRDVMDSFLEGKDPVYNRIVSHFIGAFFAEKEDLLKNATPQQLKEAAIVKEVGAELRTELEKHLSDVAGRVFVQPLMQVVASMPKEELAILAESLINLTALKRKASRETETVGGPTDVAVISKGDGFIWIKRKHYFDPKLNPQFSANYLQGGSI